MSTVLDVVLGVVVAADFMVGLVGSGLARGADEGRSSAAAAARVAICPAAAVRVPTAQEVQPPDCNTPCPAPAAAAVVDVLGPMPGIAPGMDCSEPSGGRIVSG